MSPNGARAAYPRDIRALLFVAISTVLALIVFGGAWKAVHYGFYAKLQEVVVDTPVYERYGDAMAGGKLPYEDFSLEYPPGALPVFVLPSLSHRGDEVAYRTRFESIMRACGAAMIVLIALTLALLGSGRLRLVGALGLVAAAPLLHGSLVLTRYDLWPAVLAAAALLASLAERHRLSAVALGLSTAAKGYAIVLLPVMLVWTWRHRGAREARVYAAVFVATVAAVVLPFVAVAPRGVWEAFSGQAQRPLQIESLGSSFLLAAHQALGLDITMRSSPGSQNLVGTLPDALAVVQSIALAVVLVGLWAAFGRGSVDRDRFVRFAAATVCALLALGKVLSPQFLIWLVPLVPLVRGRRGFAACALLVTALVLTQIWFPFRYWDLALHFDALASWVVLARDLVLVALLAVLVWPATTTTASAINVKDRAQFTVRMRL